MFTTELLNLVIRVSVLLAAGYLAARLLERKSAAMAHGTLVMTLACTLMLPLIVMTVPGWQWTQPGWMAIAFVEVENTSAVETAQVDRTNIDRSPVQIGDNVSESDEFPPFHLKPLFSDSRESSVSGEGIIIRADTQPSLAANSFQSPSSQSNPLPGGTAVPAMTVTGRDGIFRLPVVAGEYELSLRHQIDGFFVNAGPSRRGLIIQGTVTDKDGKYQFRGFSPYEPVYVSGWSDTETANDDIFPTFDHPDTESITRTLDLQLSRGTTFTGRVMQNGPAYIVRSAGYCPMARSINLRNVSRCCGFGNMAAISNARVLWHSGGSFTRSLRVVTMHSVPDDDARF